MTSNECQINDAKIHIVFLERLTLTSSEHFQDFALDLNFVITKDQFDNMNRRMQIYKNNENNISNKNDWLKLITNVWVFYGNQISIDKIYKTFKSNNSELCSSCDLGWMENFYKLNCDRDANTLVDWCYTFPDDDAEIVKFMCNKYTYDKPKYVSEWKSTFAKEITKIYEKTKTLEPADYTAINLAQFRYCIAFNCISVARAICYWDKCREKVDDAVTMHLNGN